MKRATYNILLSLALALCVDNAFAQSANPHELPWKPIQDSNVLWRKRVLREIDIYDWQNVSLRNDPHFPQEYVFANVLLNGINTGVYRTYATIEPELQTGAADSDLFPRERDLWVYSDNSLPDISFSNPLNKNQVAEIITCNPATLSGNSKMYVNFCAQHTDDMAEFQIEIPIAKKRKKTKAHNEAIPIHDTASVSSCVYPQQVDHYRIVEDWIFDKSQGQMVVHIAAVAPVAQGKSLFWLSYADIREYLARYKVYVKKRQTDLNWEEYFESRKFSSRITRVGR